MGGTQESAHDPSGERAPARSAPLHRAHARSADEVLRALGSSHAGLARDEVGRRLRRFGYNVLPRAEPPSPLRVFLRQFRNPLIYVLLIAAIVSLFLADWTDAGFIFLVLLINAAVGAWQEYSAQRSALALRQLVTVSTRVLRAGDAFEINAEEIVPGDIVLLESGSKVPADLRLIEAHGFEVDESLLTGESLPVAKDLRTALAEDCALAERVNMAFAGTLVTRGRAHGLVVATGLATELGRIASAVLGAALAKPPLLERMERFTFRIAVAIGAAVLLMAAVALWRGTPPVEIFFLAVALEQDALSVALRVVLASVSTGHITSRNRLHCFGVTGQSLRASTSAANASAWMNAQASSKSDTTLFNVVIGAPRSRMTEQNQLTAVTASHIDESLISGDTAGPVRFSSRAKFAEFIVQASVTPPMQQRQRHEVYPIQASPRTM